MTYTTVTLVAQMFPTFTRNGPKGPSDALIQQFINDEAGEIDAILQRRFFEAFSQTAGQTLAAQFATWIAGLAASSQDVAGLLEKINRFGACGEIGKTFESLGIATFAKLAREHEAQAQEMLARLNARNEKGEPAREGGDYDYLFDPQAKIETPRPQLWGIAGGDQPRQTLEEEGLSNDFGKFDRRGT